VEFPEFPIRPSGAKPVVTEAEARGLLRQFDGAGGVEVWISLQSWQVAPEGWSVTEDLEGWTFSLLVVPGGLLVSASAPDGRAPAVWLVKE
jgi:hypothetical protein